MPRRELDGCRLQRHVEARARLAQRFDPGEHLRRGCFVVEGVAAREHAAVEDAARDDRDAALLAQRQELVRGAAVERQSPQLPALPGQIVAPVPDLQEARKRNPAALAQGVVAPPPEINHGIRAVASMSIDVVAPMPDASAAGVRRTLNGPEASVVEPPPAVNAASIRKLGDINIGRSDVIAPAPQLSVEAQRTLATLGSGGKAIVPPPPAVDTGASAAGSGRHVRAQSGLGGSGAEVVPPPPSMQASHSADTGGRLIALGIRPAVTPPAEPPVGNRRGTFAATPEGKTGAAGTPDVRASDASGTDGHGIGTSVARNGTGSGSATAPVAGVPPGLHVGAASRPPTSSIAGGDSSTKAGNSSGNTAGAEKTEIASISRPRVSAAPQPKAELVENPSPLEQQIFHDRRLYSMKLNKPNLNSAGGSWVMRFAELDIDHEKGDLLAPVADCIVCGVRTIHCTLDAHTEHSFGRHGNSERNQ